MSQHRNSPQPPDPERGRRSLRGRLLAIVLRPTAPPLWLGILVAATFITAETALVHQLQEITSANAFGALFLLGVLVVSAGWGFRLAVATSLGSALVYVYFHLETSGALVPMHAQDAVAIIVFLPVALLANILAGQARLRAAESEQRRREADLAAELARLMLRATDLRPALDAAGRRMSQVLGLPFAVLEPDIVAATEYQEAIPLYDGTARLGTLLVPHNVPKPTCRRLRRLVPSLEALLAAARDREEINAALEASRKELERFFDLTSDLLYIGGETDLRRVNPAFERTFGFPTSELLSRPFLELIHPADRARTRAVVGTLFRSGGAAQFENRCIRSDGGERWIEWSLVSEGDLFYGAARDVTDRRLEQDRLREAQRTIEASHAEVSAMAEQQAALRRVATMVARGVDTSEVYPAAVTELSRGLGIDNVVLLQYASDEAFVLLASRDEHGLTKMDVGERLLLEGQNVAARIMHTGGPARMDNYEGAAGPTAERIRQLGLRSAVGAPIIVDGRPWGALVIGSSQAELMPPETEARIGDFADLVATAISNAETRAELTASRARIVTAGDQARRRFERDLHDGAQQRVVSLGLELRALEASIPPGQQDLRDRLSHVVAGLAGVSTELQEISRGIHPAILSNGGLEPAIKTLARRSLVPVTLDLEVDRRMPESVEVAAYYVVAEALTNAAKHSQASEVSIRATAEDHELRLSISDDGIGGAVAGRGSGLIGLKDRVEALAGHLDISSPPGSGTTLVVAIPLDGQ
jgi:PAS domain S-box-containing protein